MASVSRSLDLAGSHWGLRKKTQRQTYRKAWDWVGPALLVRDAGDPLRLQVHLFIQQVWESGVNCRLSSHGSSCVGGRNNAAVVCCYLLHTILTTSACPVFPARQCCWTLPPLGGSMPISQGAPWHSCAHAEVYLYCLSLPTCKAEPCSPPCQGLPSQHKGLWHSLAHVKVLFQSISYWSSTWEFELRAYTLSHSSSPFL
jgi:hypothetical protein